MNSVAEILAALYDGKSLSLRFSCRRDANELRQKLATLKHRQEIPYQKLGMDIDKLVLRQVIESAEEGTEEVVAKYYLQSREEFRQELLAQQAKKVPQFTIISIEEKV